MYANLQQIFVVSSGELLHFGDIIAKTTYGIAAETWNIAKPRDKNSMLLPERDDVVRALGEWGLPRIKDVKIGLVSGFQEAKKLNEQRLPHANFHLMQYVHGYHAIYVEAELGETFREGILEWQYPFH